MHNTTRRSSLVADRIRVIWAGSVLARRWAGIARHDAPQRVAGLIEIGVWDERIRPFLRTATVWAAVESSPELSDWGVTAETRDHLRSVVDRDGLHAAADLVPGPVVDDVILPDPDPAAVAEVGRSIGATAIAIHNFDTATIPVGVAWAREVTVRL